MASKFVLLVVLAKAAAVFSSPLAAAEEPDPSLAFSVQVDGQTFINKV